MICAASTVRWKCLFALRPVPPASRRRGLGLRGARRAADVDLPRDGGGDEGLAILGEPRDRGLGGGGEGVELRAGCVQMGDDGLLFVEGRQ
jgi:hypothetical protein